VVHYPTAGVEKSPGGAAALPGQQNGEATKLLAEARAARASWESFPGFTADIEVAADGKISRGHVQVNPKGKLELELDDSSLAPWTKATLGSIVGHRLAGRKQARPHALSLTRMLITRSAALSRFWTSFTRATEFAIARSLSSTATC